MNCTRLKMSVNFIDCVRCGQENCDERINGDEPLKIDGLVERKCKTENKMGQECMGCSEPDCPFRLFNQSGIHGAVGPDDSGLAGISMAATKYMHGRYDVTKVYHNGDIVEGNDGMTYTLDRDPKLIDSPNNDPSTIEGLHYGWIPYPLIPIMNGCKHGFSTKENPCQMCIPIQPLPNLLINDSDGQGNTFGIRRRYNWEQMLWNKMNELVERVNNLS